MPPGRACSPRGTPLALRERIAQDVARVLASPEVVERFRILDYQRFDAGPQAYANVIASETGNWAGVIRKAGLRLD
ncbi:MAG: hypothetical protein IPG91_18715 [Ideonella sp.]|nr:hypothetical protein [Ideonella sp.]